MKKFHIGLATSYGSLMKIEAVCFKDVIFFCPDQLKHEKLDLIFQKKLRSSDLNNL